MHSAKHQPQTMIDALRLVRTEGVGPITHRRLMGRYGSAGAALEALPHLTRAGGRHRPPNIPSIDDAAREIDRVAALGGQLIFIGEPGYPPLMALLEDAPPCLMVLGDAALLHKPAIAIVGGRNASANGQKLAEGLAAELASHLVVISGLARGIDAAAHKGALSTGRTVAAIAGGLDVAYPPGHEDLQRKIAETGALVTEAAPGTVPQARHFPRRNRIIAGLSLGVVVIEAAPRSGSLITAGIAQDLGREVFAVPGSPQDPRSRGANDLLRQGAVMTESAADILANLPLLTANFSPSRQGRNRVLAAQAAAGITSEDPPKVPSEVRDAVVALLGPAPTAVDDLLRRCQFSDAAVMAALLELELAGRVDTLPGNRVALSLSPDSPLFSTDAHV